MISTVCHRQRKGGTHHDQLAMSAISLGEERGGVSCEPLAMSAPVRDGTKVAQVMIN